jgi:hypothetical protein
METQSHHIWLGIGNMPDGIPEVGPDSFTPRIHRKAHAPQCNLYPDSEVKPG